MRRTWASPNNTLNNPTDFNRKKKEEKKYHIDFHTGETDIHCIDLKKLFLISVKISTIIYAKK